MAEIQGFPPIAGENARILILGSMPGRESLNRHQYYAHPRNAFWPIMSSLFDLASSSYADRARELAGRGVAVWDVLQACFRPGSLDSDIDDQSAVANDFRSFFASHPHIGKVFFNGAKAEAVYRKMVLPRLDPIPAGLPLKRLPSTSPAHAAMSLDEKTRAWKVVRELRLK